MLIQHPEINLKVSPLNSYWRIQSSTIQLTGIFWLPARWQVDKWHSFAFVSVCFVKPKKKLFSVCFGVLNLYRNNRNKQNCFETNRNNPEFSEKYLIIFFLKNIKTRRKNLPKHSLSYCSCSTTNMQRLRIKQKEAIQLSTMQGTETIPNIFSKKTQNPPFGLTD